MRLCFQHRTVIDYSNLAKQRYKTLELNLWAKKSLTLLITPWFPFIYSLESKLLVVSQILTLKTFESTAVLPLFVAGLKTHLVFFLDHFWECYQRHASIAFLRWRQHHPYGLVLNFISADRCSSVDLFILEE